MDNRVRVTHHSDQEIRLINATVDIGAVAESLGYVQDREKSSRLSRKYTRARDGDSIVVRPSPRYPGQEYLTLGRPKSEGDCGPVFNFVYYRTGSRNLGKTRKILRPFIGTLAGCVPSMPVPPHCHDDDVDRSVDRSEEWDALDATPATIKKHVVDHLEKMGLTRETLEAFRGLIRADRRKNACFASRHPDGRIVGWSIRGTRETKKFRSHHGNKALFYGPPRQDLRAEYLVVSESALDSISYWQLFHEDKDIAVSATSGSTGNYMSVVQLADRLAARRVIIATDDDAPGRKQGEDLAAVLDGAGLAWFYHRPRNAKDWNKYLLLKEAA